MAHVKIRLNRAVMLNDLTDANGNVPQPAVRMKELTTLRGTAMVADVQLATVIELPVPDTSEPTLPTRSAGMSDGWFQRLCDVAYEGALERLRAADVLRAKLRRHVARGTLVIVEDADGFLAAADALDPLAAAIADQKKADAETLLAQKAKATK